MTVSNSPLSVNSTQLNPSYALPVFLVACAVPLVFVQVWVAGAVALFGLFLMFQTVSIRLVFTATDLDIYRNETLLRRFPYREWQNWRIFYPALPILFYFKEVKSIHFLPMLFDPKMLRVCLEKHCPLENFPN